jgi:hypothetical protein
MRTQSRELRDGRAKFNFKMILICKQERLMEIKEQQEGYVNRHLTRKPRKEEEMASPRPGTCLP